jgi:predicted DNA binding CopG/RHH family protein
MSNINDPFKNLILDEEEQAIEDSADEYVRVSDFDDSKKIIEQAATRYLELNKTKPITLRLKQSDIIKIKAKAARNGMPYQTMLGALMHDFADGDRELVIK